MSDDMTRLSVNLNAETHLVLTARMNIEGVSATELVRRAIATYGYLRASTALGDRLIIQSASTGMTEEVTFL